MSVVDIVNLIENNPITKLNGNYESKLIEKVKNTFSNYEQQMFVASFYCYLKYDSRNDFVVDLDDVWQWLGFGQKVNAKRVLEKHFLLNEDYKLLLCQLAKQTNQTKGGHNKEVFMLNVNTFKKFCLKAETKKASEIHDYFIKLENIMFEVTKEECQELKSQLLEIEDVKKKEYELQLVKEKILEREKVLLSQYGTAGSIFYIIRVKTLKNGHYVLKVGESRIGVSARFKEHTGKYDECVLLDCFLVNRSKDFESFIIHNEIVRPNKVNDLKGHETELELILIGKNLSYKTLLNIVQNNIKYFNDNNNEVKKLELELEILKLKAGNPSQNNDDLLNELLSTTKTLMRKIDNLERTNKEILDKLSITQTKVVTGFNEPLSNLGPRLQKINPETLLLVKVYENVTECMKENAEMKRPSINMAAEKNTIYNGFRWVLVDRCLDPNVIHDIKQTVITRLQNLGYIAKLNKEKTEILNVYLDRKTAAEKNGYASSSSLETVVKNYSLSNGYYYTLYDNCEEELRENFIKINKDKEPRLYKNGIGQFDDKNELVQEFVCKYDCIKSIHISDKTLEKSLSNNVMYCGFYYKQIGSKLSCF